MKSQAKEVKAPEKEIPEKAEAKSPMKEKTQEVEVKEPPKKSEEEKVPGVPKPEEKGGTKAEGPMREASKPEVKKTEPTVEHPQEAKVEANQEEAEEKKKVVTPEKEAPASVKEAKPK